MMQDCRTVKDVREQHLPHVQMLFMHPLAVQ